MLSNLMHPEITNIVIRFRNVKVENGLAFYLWCKKLFGISTLAIYMQDFIKWSATIYKSPFIIHIHNVNS